MESLAEQIVYIGQLMFERRLTDISGGNISARDGDTIYITPRFAGSKQHWRLKPDEIMYGPVYSDELFENPRLSREGKAHFSIYRNFPEAQAVIHAHPFHIMPFAAARKPLVPVLESLLKFGIIAVIPQAPAHSQEIANNIVAGLRGQEERMRKQAAAVLLPAHGIIIAGKDLFAAVDALERLDWNAWCILMNKQLD